MSLIVGIVEVIIILVWFDFFFDEVFCFDGMVLIFNFLYILYFVMCEKFESLGLMYFR